MMFATTILFPYNTNTQGIDTKYRSTFRGIYNRKYTYTNMLSSLS